MKGFWVFVPILLILTLFFSNYDRLTVSHIGPIIGLGIDKENNEYHITLQLANVKSAKSQSQLSPITTFDGKASTLSEALRLASYQMPKTIDTSHMLILLISEDLLKKEGIGPTLDFLLRLKKSAVNIPIAVVKKGKVADLMKIYTPVQDFPSMDIRKMIINVVERNSTSTFISASNLATILYKKGEDIYLPELEVNGDIKKGSTFENIQTLDPPTSISLKGYTIFHDSKAVSSLTLQEGFIYFLTLGNIKEGIIETSCFKDKKAVLSINNIQSEKKLIKVKKPTIKFSIKIDGTLVENKCKYITESNFKNAEKDLEKKFEEDLSKKIDNLILKSKDTNSDFLGLGNTYYINQPRKWKKVESNYLKSVTVKTSVKVNIQKVGNVNYHP